MNLCSVHVHVHVHVQWNPSIAATVTEWYFGYYMEVAVIWRWLLHEGGLHTMEVYVSLIGTRAVGRYIADGRC